VKGNRNAQPFPLTGPEQVETPPMSPCSGSNQLMNSLLKNIIVVVLTMVVITQALRHVIRVLNYYLESRYWKHLHSQLLVYEQNKNIVPYEATPMESSHEKKERP